MMIINDVDDFIQEEFKNCNLGDKRLSKRLLSIVTKINKNPALSIPNLMDGEESEIKAIYRFFQNQKTTDQNVLHSHYTNTLERCSRYSGNILLISDSTFISPYKKFDGLKNKGKGVENCLRIHYVLAVSEDGKQIFGMTDFRIISDDLSKTNITLKNEADIWSLVAQSSVNRMLERSDGEDMLSRSIYVADREGDDFELMDKLRKIRLGFIIRSQYNRTCCYGDEKYSLPSLEEFSIKHGEKYTVLKKVGNKKVETEVQRSVLSQISIVPPQKFKNSKNLDCNMVWIKEIEPTDQPDINWRLITDQSIQDSSLSQAVVLAYECRWIIEEMNKAAKTGASVEKRQFTELDHYKPFIGITYVIAWRMLFVRNLGEIEGDAPIENFFAQEEIEYMKAESPHDNITTVQDALLFIARLGGFTRRYKRPGWIILWQGWTKFYERVTGYLLYKKVHGTS